MTLRYPEGCCLCSGVSQHYYLLMEPVCPVTTNLIPRVNVRTPTTTTTAALEARNLKTANQVYYVDYYYRFFTAVPSIARTCYFHYRLLLCHRLVRHVLSYFRKKNCPGIQNPKSSPQFADVFLTSRKLYAFTISYRRRIRKALDSTL